MEEPVKLTDDANQRKQKSHEAINQKPNPTMSYRKKFTGSYTELNRKKSAHCEQAEWHFARLQNQSDHRICWIRLLWTF